PAARPARRQPLRDGMGAQPDRRAVGRDARGHYRPDVDPGDAICCPGSAAGTQQAILAKSWNGPPGARMDASPAPLAMRPFFVPRHQPGGSTRHEKGPQLLSELRPSDQFSVTDQAAEAISVALPP